jgi:hypothetical protein
MLPIFNSFHFYFFELMFETQISSNPIQLDWVTQLKYFLYLNLYIYIYIYFKKKIKKSLKDWQCIEGRSLTLL